MITFSFSHSPDMLEVLAMLIHYISWPIVVLVILWCFHSQISMLILSLRKFRWKDIELQFEMEESKSEGPAFVDELRIILKNSPHSYRWIRENTNLTLTDDEFNQVVEKHPGIFEQTRIVRRNSKGKHVTPGWPGVKLKESHG